MDEQRRKDNNMTMVKVIFRKREKDDRFRQTAMIDTPGKQYPVGSKSKV